MEIKEAIRSAIKELIVPEINQVKQENLEIKTLLTLTNKRLDDINGHLVDQSRRIDSIREELVGRIDETNKRIDSLREELTKRIDETNQRLDAMGTKFDDRLNRLYEVIVRRDEHTQVVERIIFLERDVAELKRHIAA